MKVPAALLDETVRLILDLCAIPSPTGFTHAAADHVARSFESLGLEVRRSRKGTLAITLGGSGHGVAFAAHVDTLGAMVRSISDKGRLRLVNVGGFHWNTVEGENCQVHTRDDKVVSGTLQSKKASHHVFREQNKVERSDETVEVVLDERVRTKEDVEALGIRAGDFVSFDPRTRVTESGYLKSRHLDNKAGVAILWALARLVKSGEVKLARETHVIITTYEEVGHGGANVVPAGTEDLIAVDMGCVGDDLGTTEHDVSICAKDSSGPYDHRLTSELVRLAKRDGIAHAVDIYPFYSSDVAVAMRAGHDCRHAVLGPGVFASHGYERTHRDAIANTLALLAAFVAEPVAT